MTTKEKEHWVLILDVAAKKLIKELQKRNFVSHTEFVSMLEASCKEEVMFLFVNRLSYTYEDGLGPYVKIKCSFGQYKFKVSFYMAEPHGKFNDRTPIPYNYKLETNF